MGSVLVVEDDRGLREALRNVLESEGYSVCVAENGRVALDMLALATPQLIFLDLMMPVMNGWELMEAMKVEPTLRTIPIVVFSAAMKQADLSVNATFLKKPVQLESVLELAERYCA